MTGGGVQRVKPGEPFAIRADTWNDLLTLADAGRRSGFPSGTGPGGWSPWAPRQVIEAFRGPAETLTIADRAPLVLRFTSLPALTESDLAANRDPHPRGLVIPAVGPADDTAGTAAQVEGAPVGIALGNIGPGKSGPIATGGAVLAWVNVSSTGHGFARLEKGTAGELVSADAGPCRILFAEGTGRKLCLILVNSAPGAGGGSAGVAVDTVHVINTYSGSTLTGWQCERVVLDTFGIHWPPVKPTPLVQYAEVRESENREPRWRDEPTGPVTHIIPLYQDNQGRYFIQFWKTLSTFTKDEITDWVWNSTTCTVTPVITNYTFTLENAPFGEPGTGLKVTYEPTPAPGEIPGGSLTWGPDDYLTWGEDPVIWGSGV
jgi:hypothetical protein